MDKVLISFYTKQDCRAAFRLVNSGCMHNYSLSCSTDDPGVTIIMMRFRTYVASDNQSHIKSWEKVVSSNNPNAFKNG